MDTKGVLLGLGCRVFQITAAVPAAWIFLFVVVLPAAG